MPAESATHGLSSGDSFLGRSHAHAAERFEAVVGEHKDPLAESCKPSHARNSCLMRSGDILDDWFWGCQSASWTPRSIGLCREIWSCPMPPQSAVDPWRICALGISQAWLPSCSRCLAAAEPLPFHKTLSHTVSQCLQPVKGCFPRVLVIGFRAVLVAQWPQLCSQSEGHRHHLDEQQIEARRVDERGVRIRGIQMGIRGFRSHWHDCAKDRPSEYEERRMRARCWPRGPKVNVAWAPTSGVPRTGVFLLDWVELGSIQACWLAT